ncbi:ph domain associated with beige/beach domain containing protein [Dermatophagoides farinae]|uniref:Ph domain associated with beige/beach domain containing protein n=1 Tax=Dermatophagoides farinae TaxID=6954 RepID=A0A9D4SCY8_DERFA|nr:ph domain associated with beige/beach domain containing protein [Dermatophagoides farinae]
MDQDTLLSISHLHKQFADIKQNAPSIGSSQSANELHEQKIYNILPLFCKIFNNNNNNNYQQQQQTENSNESIAQQQQQQQPNIDIFETFADATSFTQMVSRLMVTEIRRRASNKTTELASLAIVEFLEISPTVTNIPANKKGWILLSTLNILVSFNSSQLIAIMTNNSLASTLVKCLYLFFDLPPFDDDDDDEDEKSNNNNDYYLSIGERRQLLQKVFSQLLQRLCTSPTALNDLTRKDDLILLFNVITSWCPEHNRMWRKTAADTIITMAKHGNINVDYLHSKNCIHLFVENVQRILELGTAPNNEILLMIRTFIGFMFEYVHYYYQHSSITNNSNVAIQILLDDFNECFGYQFFVDFGTRLEQSEDFDLLSDFLILICLFTKIGATQLKPRPLSVNQVFIIENFSIPKPSIKNSIKNLKAFSIYVSLWQKSRTIELQRMILNQIQKIYAEDKANYFLLESQNTLSSFADQLEEKNETIQSIYYSLLEYIVTELNYVPCKELITIGMILKKQNSTPQSSLLALKSLNSMLKLNTIFKEVFREVGLVDILCTTFNSFIEILEQQQQQQQQQIEINLTELLEILIQLLIDCSSSGNNSGRNSSLSSSGGNSGKESSRSNNNHRESINKSIRKRAFTLIQQLILSNNSEENLSQLLVLLHRDRNSFNSVQEMLSLKLSVLKSLLIVLSENHRVRALFRKIGGFVSVISVIVYMENYLIEIPSSSIHSFDSRQIWNLLRFVFAMLTTAMRFEPANSKYFAQEICSPSFTDSLRLLGCFDELQFGWRKSTKMKQEQQQQQEEETKNYQKLFESNVDELQSNRKYSKNECACVLMRLLYDMAMDSLDRNIGSNKTGTHQQQQQPKQSTNIIETNIIIYPCIIDSIFQLLKFIESGRLCRFLMEKIGALLRLERNCQAICETGLVTELMNSAYVDIFMDESNQLHQLIRYIFERLAAHHIQAKDLRIFLRLSNPLNSIPVDEIKPKIFHRDRSIPLSRIKSMISISTPRDSQDDYHRSIHGSNLRNLSPPFTEFDMNPEGFSCIFIPSIAPISTAGNFSNGPSSLLTGAIVGNSDVPVLVNGGIGTGERAFPSQSGLSFTSWIFIGRSDPSNDNHTINVLTLYRATQPNAEYSCLKAYISLQEKTMTISTQELPIFTTMTMQMNLDSDHNVRFPVPELTTTNSWHHIVIVLNRALLKNSTICVYIDGCLRLSKKLSYISSIVGGSYGIANTSPLYINAFIGTPPHYRKQGSRLVWKQGPCHLIEEALGPPFVSYIYMLGPNYIGSFQAIAYKQPSQYQQQLQLPQQQIAEDKLIFGLNARATSVMTLSKMRRVYSKFDCKQIAKIIGLSTHENATPIYVLHNSAGHLCGPSRPLGGVLIGNIGARCFVPKPITLTVADIGGTYLLLGLVANAHDNESLYASCKALVCIFRANRELQLEMDRINGYQILAMLLKRKRLSLNSHILTLLFELVDNLDARLIINQTNRSLYSSTTTITNVVASTVSNSINSGQNQSHLEYPSNYRAFKELFIDSIDLWFQCDLLKSLLDRINEIIINGSTSSSMENAFLIENRLNIYHLRKMNLLSRLFTLFKDHMELKDDEKLVPTIMIICFRLLNKTNRSKDLLCIGQFIVSLLPICQDDMQQNNADKSEPQQQSNEVTIDSSIELINSLLKIILQLMSRNTPALNGQMQDELVRSLGFDWFLLFIGGGGQQKKLHMETITIGLVNLMLLLSNPVLYSKFREGHSNGQWLKDADSFIENRSTGFQLAGFNISTAATKTTTTTSSSSAAAAATTSTKQSITKIQRDLFTLPGFQHLNWLLTYHLYEPKIYLILFQTIFGHYRTLTPKTLEDIDSFDQLSMEHLLNVLVVDVRQLKQEKIYGKDLILSIIGMINAICCERSSSTKRNEYPTILFTFIKFIYNHNRDFRIYCQTNTEFLHHLCRALIFVQSANGLNNNNNDMNESIELSSSSSQLIDHSVCQSILEFIMAIFINIINTNPYTLTMNQTAQSFFMNNKPCTLFNSLLNYMGQCRLGQTKIMSLFMDCVCKSLDCNNQSSSLSQQNVILNFQNSYSNIVVLMSAIVDKLWQNCYIDDRRKVLDCLIRLLRANSPNDSSSVAMKSQQQSISSFKTSLKNLTSQVSELNLLCKSINRSILYLISRSLDSMSDRIQLFEILQLIHTNSQLLIISKCNNDPEFFACLTHCLLQLIQEETICLTSVKDRTSQTTWYIGNNSGSMDIGTDTDEGTLLITSTAKKIWQEIYLSRKTLLEETLKISLTSNNSAFGIESCDLSRFRDVLYEPTLKCWSNYIEQESQRLKKKPATSSLSFDLPLPNSNVLTEKFTNINKLNNLVTKSAGGLVSKIVGGTSGVVGSAISSAVGTTRKEVFRSSSSSDSTHSPHHSTLIPLWTLMSKNDVMYWSSIHELIVKNFVNFQAKQKRTLDYNLRKYVYNEWLNSEYEFLTRERTIWGPLYGSKRFDKWMMDMTEGPNRMRKKMIRNDEFYLNYPFRPEMENAKYPKFRSPISLDSKDYFRRIHSEKYFHLDKDEDVQSFEYEIDELPCASISDSNETSKGSLSDSNRPKTSLSNTDDDYPEFADPSDSLDIFEAEQTIGEQQVVPAVGNNESGSSNNNNKQTPNKSVAKDVVMHEDNNEMQTILRLLEEGEKISHMFRVARVQGLDSYEGLLLFGKEHFYLIDGFTLLKTKEIRDIDSLPPGVYDSIIPNTPSSSSVSVYTGKKVCNKFAFEDIREVHKRRYLLQPIALEIFSMDGRNSLMVFPRNLRNKVYARFLSVAVHITDNAQDSLMGQKRNVNVETGGLLSNLIGETSVTQRWVRGEISNFQYLMNLNTLAGRSYNDLMQYPVFPWIVADYSSYELDLNNPASFRDLGKPMGAQTPDRLEQFKKRFSEWDADTNIKGGDELIQGAYHYGTFYSSAMIVASYLVRIEPFTQHFLRLQGGHFDLADRMFHSIGDAWLSASKHNMADLKELIPEFFYLPEFLVNSNRYDFGCKQNGTRLNDVILPNWAKDDPREFIRVHRAALESDYVSAHLHEWIDLIFGYKQNGPPAIDAVNVFHHLFYEGNADIYNIDDPLKKNATIGFINNFGQVPMQLFKKPHPQKKTFQSNMVSTPLISSLPPLLSSVNLSGSNISTSKVFIHNLEYLKPMMHPIKELKGAVGQIVQQEKTILAVEQNKVLIPPLYNRCVAWGFADHSFRIGPYESDRALYVWESELFPPNGEILCTTVPNSRIIITAGTNSVIYVWRVKTKSLTLSLHQKLYGHTEAVTCLASSSAYGIVVSGSRDKTCIIWDLNRFVFIRQLGGGQELVHRSPIAAAAINDLTGDIATCCSTMLYLWSINGDLVAQVNTLDCSPSSAMNSTMASPQQQNCPPQNSAQILCLAFSSYNEWDADNVILTGSSDGVVKMWALRYVQERSQEMDEFKENISKTTSSSSSSSSSSPSSSTSSADSSVSEDLKNSIALNPSKDEIVRRLSIVSTKNENEDSEENSTTPVDEGDNVDINDWNQSSNYHQQQHYQQHQHQQQQLIIRPQPTIALTHSESFTESKPEQLLHDTSSKSSTKLLLGNSLQAGPVGGSIRNSKSDTALAESLSKSKPHDIDEENPCLKMGHRWATKLLFRSKLTMHTAYERKDNKDPAAITCIAISKDHRNLFVGDARGRIFCWAVNENKNLAADHWIKDDVATNCTSCSIRFSITERKHHCRNCGKVFCARCSRFEATIVRLKIMKPVRVCQNCFIYLQQQQPKTTSSG